MCGLFGFIGSRMDIGLVSKLAELAETRGPHAYGFVWTYGDGQFHRFVAPGRISQRKSDLLKLLDVKAFVGHCRLSTSGTFSDSRNNQPLLMGGREGAVALAHNGNVYSSRQVYDLYNYVPKTENDSEALLLAIYCAFGSLPERVESAVNTCDPEQHQAALILSGAGLVAFRRYQPLFIKNTSGGTYLCSRPVDKSSTLLSEGIAHHFS